MKIDLRALGLTGTGLADGAAAPIAPETAMPSLPITLPEDSCVRDLLHRAEEMGLSVHEVRAILLNGQSAGPDDPLHDGDAVTIIGQTSGV